MSDQSTLVTVGHYQAYLNLSMYEQDYNSPFYGQVKKGTWSFMVTYPRANRAASKRVTEAFRQVTARFYVSEADSKAAVAWLTRTLEASSDGWREGFGGMGAAYIGKRREE